jgi:ribonucleoside-triphosphate reductase
MIIKKRDGTKVPFRKQKVIDAVNKALYEVDGCLYETETAEEIGEAIEAHVQGAEMIGEVLSVEDIQDRVEDYLMQSERRDVARAYIRYRYKKEVIRNRRDDFINAIGEKLNATNVQNQNANLDEKSFGGRIGEASSYMTKDYALNYMVSKMARENHLNNMIYIHDLDAYAVGSHNCLTIPFDDLLANGFNTRQCDVRPANSVNTAFQLVAVIFQLQSLCQFGGVSASHIDWTMVPYVRKSFFKHYKDGLKYVENYVGINPKLSVETDINSQLYKDKPKAYNYAMDMTTKEVYQAVEAMYHNLNTLQSRSGNQLPFTSLNYGTCILPEGRMVTKALLDVSIKGLGKLHKTSIFPCGIFQCMKGVNREPGDPNYDLYRLALRSTAQRLYPNYANVDWSGNAGYDKNDPRTYFSTMGCRTANGWDVNGLGQLKDGRGNICPVTIIMPTLAMMAKESGAENIVDEFMFLLEAKIFEAKDMLLERYHWICAQSPDSAKFMYENNVMAGYIPEEGIQSALRHGTLVIGSLGLAETL